ncbi:hypothetical protein PROFUN_09338 [Planoprotostelium fungivorum]|nr:hypothetical protein PROFUN_09338 [Planoprotostelium fungivorum]
MNDSPLTLTTRPRSSTEDRDRVGTACVAFKPCQRCVSKGIECVMPEVKTRGVKSRKRTHHEFTDMLNIPQIYDVTNPAEMDASLNLEYDLLSSDLDFQLQNFDAVAAAISPDLGSSLGEFGSSIDTPFSSSPDRQEQDQTPSSGAANQDNCPPSLQLMSGASCSQRMEKLGIRDTPAQQQAWERYLNKVNMLRNWVTQEQKEMLSRNFDMQKEALIKGTEEIMYPSVLWGRCGILLHANKPFRELTGFNQSTPTDAEEYNIMDMFSTDTVLRKYESFSKVFSGLANTYTDTQAKIKTFAKNRDEKEFEFTEVVMAISIKRDVFELPHLFHAVFVPMQAGLGDLSM